jgi:hypothetical protein
MAEPTIPPHRLAEPPPTVSRGRATLILLGDLFVLAVVAAVASWWWR